MKVFSIIFVIALSFSQVLAVDEDAVVARVLAALEKGILTVVQNHWFSRFFPSFEMIHFRAKKSLADFKVQIVLYNQ